MSSSLRIVTRTSPLARWQADFVKSRLQALDPALSVDIIGIQTQADKWQDVPLYKMGGKSLFVKELEAMLMKNEADIAVHSLKDVAVQLPESLMLGAILKREDPRDAWICPVGEDLMTLPTGSRVGTSSLRRLVQMKAQRPDLQFIPLRGNVDTRIKKCVSGEYDAIVLAMAGLTRLKLTDLVHSCFEPDLVLPAVGQGALGIECRVDDQKIIDRLQAVIDPITQNCVTAERSMNAALGGSCQIPVAGYATYENEQLVLKGRVGDPDTLKILEATAQGNHPEALGQQVAEALSAQGADAIIARLTTS